MRAKPMSIGAAAIYNFLTMGVIFPWLYVWAADGVRPGRIELTVLVTLVAQIPLTLCYAALSTISPVRGGDLVYQRRAFGNWGYVCVMAGLVIWILQWVAIAGWLFASLGAGPWLLVAGSIASQKLLVTYGQALISPTGVLLTSLATTLAAVLMLRRGLATYVKVQRVLFALTLAGVLAMVLVFTRGRGQCVHNLNGFVAFVNGPSNLPFTNDVYHAVSAKGIQLGSGASWMGTLALVPIAWTSLQWSTYSVEQNDEIDQANRFRTHLWAMLVPAIAVAVLLALIAILERSALGAPFLEAAARSYSHRYSDGVLKSLGNIAQPCPSVLAMAASRNQFLVAVIALGFLANAFQVTCNCFIGATRLLGVAYEERLLPVAFWGVGDDRDAILERLHWLYFLLALPWILAYSLIADWTTYTLGVTFANGCVFGLTALAVIRVPSRFRNEWEQSELKSWPASRFRWLGGLGALVVAVMLTAMIVQPAYGIRSAVPLALVATSVVVSFAVLQGSPGAGHEVPGIVDDVRVAPWRTMWLEWQTAIAQHMNLLGVIAGILSLVAAVMFFSIGNYLSALKDQIEEQIVARQTERTEAAQLLRARDEDLRSLTLGKRQMTLLSPASGGSIADPTVTFQWSAQGDQAPRGYLLQVATASELAANTVPAPIAIAPEAREFSMRVSVHSDSAGDVYLWRMVPGDFDDQIERDFGDWTPFQCFTCYSTHQDRIRARHELRIGVSYGVQSGFLTRGLDGKPHGIDMDIVNAIAHHLQQRLGIHETCRIAVDNYVSIDAALFRGLMRGEVDVVVGTVTRAAYRERRGVKFSHGYYYSHTVLVSRPGRWPSSVELKPAHRVGVLGGTTNAVAAEQLRTRGHFHVVERATLQELAADLDEERVDFLIVDEALAQPLIDDHKLELVRELQDELASYYRKETRGEEQYAVAVSDDGMKQLVDEALTAANVDSLIASKALADHLPHATGMRR